MVLTIVAILLVAFQPFKQSMSHLTHITIMFTSFLALSHIAALGVSFAGENLSHHVPFIGVLFVSLFFPLLYISGLILHSMAVQQQGIWSEHSKKITSKETWL